MNKSDSVFCVIVETHIADGTLFKPAYGAVFMSKDKEEAEQTAERIHQETALHVMVIKTPLVMERSPLTAIARRGGEGG